MSRPAACIAGRAGEGVRPILSSMSVSYMSPASAKCHLWPSHTRRPQLCAYHLVSRGSKWLELGFHRAAVGGLGRVFRQALSVEELLIRLGVKEWLL